MPETITQQHGKPIVGGVFTSKTNAQDAYNEIIDLGVAPDNIQMFVKPINEHQAHTFNSELVSHGVAASQAQRCINALDEDRVLLVAYEVDDKPKVINALNRHGAQHDPDGSRNLREDVAGMTTGAAVGMAGGAVAGTVAGGPLGGIAGAIGGEAIGAAAGAAIGKQVEENR